MRKVVAIVGRPGVGKSTVAEFLTSKGFTRFGLGDVCREEAARKGNRQPSRTYLQDIGDQLREEFGPDILSQRVWEKIENQDVELTVIEGSRHPSDIAFLKRKANKLITLALFAPQRVRYERIVGRGLVQDPSEWEKFLNFDTRDAADKGNPNGQSTEAVVALADYKIDTNNPKEKVFEKVEEILKKEGII